MQPGARVTDPRMPQISASQFDRLLQQDMPDFVDKTLAVVRESRLTDRQGDDMLRDSIRAGFKRALQHGLTTDEQLMEYGLSATPAEASLA